MELFYMILIRVIMSFVNPHWQGPLADFLRLLTEPLLKLGRRVVPDISGAPAWGRTCRYATARRAGRS